MSRGNEIDPRMMGNVPIIGGQRMPTRAEEKQMEKDAITMAVLQVAGTALSSILESGPASVEDGDVSSAIQVATDLLKKSEETKGDYGDHIGKRKLRNQLAAQLIYSALRGGVVYKTNLIHRAFNAASKILEKAEEYAENETVETTPISDIIST